MGYSYNAEAGRTLDRIQAYALAQGVDKPSNEWAHRGRRYFYEVDARDQPDGGIRGRVLRMEGNMAHRAGAFRIAGDGRIVQAPGPLLALVEQGGKAAVSKALRGPFARPLRAPFGGAR